METAPPPLFAAVRAGDAGAVRALLAGGANPRLADAGETPLHAAARRGPVAVVEALIEGGAFDWQLDGQGRTALDVARTGPAQDRAAIVALLDRGAIADPAFRAAVDAIHAGDVDTLARLLDAEPRLLRDRIVGPEAYRRAPRPGYFTDPRLVWFVANNPRLADEMPAAAAVAQTMIDRGVDRADLDVTLELTMSSAAAREHGQQIPLMRVLLAAGAQATRDAVVTAAAYRERDALRALLDGGYPIGVPIAAALGDDARLRALLPGASRADVQTAFGLAAINGNVEAVRIACDAGADVDAPLPVHAHMTALHQAAQDDNVALATLLRERGARTDVRDTLWDATPFGWAMFFDRPNVRALLG